MADAYCGPSNALQNFQKHTSADRTLQQDRLTQRRSPLEGFRSHEPNAGILDPEFEAFQASQPGPLTFAEPPQTAFQSFNQRGKQPAFGPPQHGADWATDFQRLHVSSPGPQMQQSPSPAQFRSSPSPAVQAPSQAPLQSQYAPQFSQPSFGGYGGYGGYGAFGSMNQGYMQQPMQARQGEPQVQQEVDMFDEAAFERAFDMAKEQVIAEENAQMHERGETMGEELEPQALNPYPHLPLLRMVMYSELINPTEENMHEFARHFALLEKHNPQQIDAQQQYIFAPLFQVLTNRSGLPYSQRYHLQERAEALFSKWTQANLSAPPSADERAERAYHIYQERFKDKYRSSPPSSRSVTDNEMLHDVQQQVSTVTGKDVVERVFDTLHARHIDPIFESKSELAPIVELETEILQNSVPKEIVNSLRQTGPESESRRLWAMANRAAFQPEVVELREQVSSQDLFERDKIQLEEAIQALPDQVQQEQKQENPLQHDENDDLARTAGELLDKVKDNQSTKFQNSQFLDLMRRFRDREVRVEGDKVVETNLSAFDDIQQPGQSAVFPTPQVSQQPGAMNKMSRADPDSNDVGEQQLRDGEDVVRYLDEPSDVDQGRSPFPSFQWNDPDRSTVEDLLGVEDTDIGFGG
ncbi:hypothetical protein CAC42_7827 [Sphaceloma murrayae]|uniref:Uncharacterized protein n=1 Tax=Sphaceloma murrayae TaxID=2082308 RepID=A0A2K1QXZ5_9PEZI|nr:hypothetical protein CAC42_7827 [Sphaceloma murrayae]